MKIFLVSFMTTSNLHTFLYTYDHDIPALEIKWIISVERDNLYVCFLILHSLSKNYSTNSSSAESDSGTWTNLLLCTRRHFQRCSLIWSFELEFENYFLIILGTNSEILKMSVFLKDMIYYLHFTGFLSPWNKMLTIIMNSSVFCINCMQNLPPTNST
jgi:hypothetical protein